MKEMTATEVARSLSKVLDAVQDGESIVVTRGGERIATIAPTPRANGATLNEIAREYGVAVAGDATDPYADAAAWARSLPVDLDGSPWPD